VSSRGSRYFAPEETVAANSLGVDQGADAVSFDVRRSADGIVVLMRDEMVDRTCNGTGTVSELTFPALRGISVMPSRSARRPAERGDGVPRRHRAQGAGAHTAAHPDPRRRGARSRGVAPRW
jgi:glycerophosphoryl diester phosphodiesterase